MDTIDLLVNKALSRRSFLAAASGTAAAAVVGCSSDGTVTLPAVAATAYTDTDILNFALNLEYLEAEFYLHAATGAGLTAADAGTGAGTTTGGTKVPVTTQTTGIMLSATTQQAIIDELAYTEQQHVRALRAALGSLAVPRPNIDILNSFAAIAQLAGLPSTFNPYANFDSFIIAASNFEGVGVTAYNGAAPLISPAGIAAGYLATAAGIMAVEAYHDGSGRTYVTASASTQTATAYPYLGYANQIAIVRSNLSGGTSTTSLTDELALTTPVAAAGSTVTANATPSTVVPADANALAFHRTTDQVMHIVYGMATPTSATGTPVAGVSKGGFFPSGLNGNIKVTMS